MNRSELEKQLQDLLEGVLDPSALAGLQQELRANPEAGEIYREYVQLHNALQIRSEGVDLLSVVPMDRVIERRKRRLLRNSGLAAVAMLFLAALAMAFLEVRSPPPLLSFSTSPGTEFSLSAIDGQDSSKEMVLDEGARLQIQRGTVELKFASGVRGIVRGPADLTLRREDFLEMARGTGWFEVPDRAVGFKVSTPDLVLTDLGTEFGVLSQPEFLDEVHVFAGKVEVLNRHGLKDQQTLVAGEAGVAGAAGRWKMIAPRRDPFLTALPKSSAEGQRFLFKDSFDSDSSDDFTSIDYARGGAIQGEFAIDAANSGVLEISAGYAVQVVHRSATLGVNQCFKTDWLTQVVAGQKGSDRPSTSQVLTDDPSKKRYCVRFRFNAGVFAIDFERGFTGSYEWFNNSPYTAPETFWVERISETEFWWYRGGSVEERIKIAEVTFDSDPGDLHIGLQAYQMTARFDNLSVVESDGALQRDREPAPSEEEGDR